MKSKKPVKIICLIAVLLSPVCAGPGVTAEIFDLRNGLITNYPNPFDSREETTSIIYSIPHEAEVRMLIYDLFGYLVREFPKERMSAGTKRIVWDGTNQDGQKVAKGGYICIVEILNGTNRIVTSRKIGVIH
jgi:flagellar hook assembly protein FlgD